MTSARRAAILAATLAIALPAAAHNAPAPIAKKLFGAEHDASRQAPEPFGSYAKGCLAGAEQLPETGPTWQAMRLSRNRNWGHPETIDFIEKLSAYAAKQRGWKGLYIGDISQPRGGPMVSGHASHQMGLDVDIWLLPPKSVTLTPNAREKISAVSLQRHKGAYVNSRWTPAHELILRAAARDPKVERIFLFPGGKVQLCKDTKGDRRWLRKIRPWWGHDDHFHVRLACPKGASDCIKQAPPPAGDGCAEAQGWVDNILNPPPPNPNAKPPKPRPELTLADLPQQCARVLSH